MTLGVAPVRSDATPFAESPLLLLADSEYFSVAHWASTLGSWLRVLQGYFLGVLDLHFLAALHTISFWHVRRSLLYPKNLSGSRAL